MSEKLVTALDDYNCRVQGELQPGGDKLPQLYITYDSKNNKFGIAVRPNMPSYTENYGVLSAPFYKTNTLYALFNILVEAAKSEGPFRRTLNLLDHPYIRVDGNPRPTRSKEPKMVGAIRVEKKQDGIVYLTLSKGNKYPNPEFKLINDEYYNIVDENNKPITEAENSKIFTQALVDNWRYRVALIIDKYKTPEWMVKKQEEHKANQSESDSSSSNGGGDWGDYT